MNIRKDPMRTAILYFLVDAVVHTPFGAYPGAMPARDEIDPSRFLIRREWMSGSA